MIISHFPSYNLFYLKFALFYLGLGVFFRNNTLNIFIHLSNGCKLFILLCLLMKIINFISWNKKGLVDWNQEWNIDLKIKNGKFA